DPIHEGHVESVKQMKARYMLDRVYVVVAGDHPIHGRTYKLSAESRLALVKKAFKNIPGVIVYDGEARTPHPVPTLDTIKKIEALEGDVDTYLMGGQDFLAYLPSFVGKEELVRDHHLIFAGRKLTHPRETPLTPAALPPDLIADHVVLDKRGHILRNSGKRVI